MALNFPSNPSNGDTFENYVYDATAAVWKRIASGIELNGISDVAITTPAEGQTLVYDSSSGDWVNETPAVNVSNLTDTTITSPSEGERLIYNGSSWINTPATSGNAIINGDFGVWQRGTGAVAGGYSADRWVFNASGATMTGTQGTFTPADLEVIGYGDAEFFMEWDITVGNAGCRLEQRIEDVRTLSGQTATVSFWAKAASGINLNVITSQQFGSGGSTAVNTTHGSVVLTTSWQRFTVQAEIPSVSGKTIGSGNYVALRIEEPDADTDTISVWGVQLEAGSVATPFRLAGGGSKAAELALCQRYFYRLAGFSMVGTGATWASNDAYGNMYPKQVLRVAPTVSISSLSDARLDFNGSAGLPVTLFGTSSASPDVVAIRYVTSTPISAGGGALMYIRDPGYIDLDSEL